MQIQTYLQESLKNGRLMRWISMPLSVYIAPMKFYSKSGEDYKYKNMVLKALNEWEKASLGTVQFNVVDTLLQSQINVTWKRVDRAALGHCVFEYDSKNRLFSAEVQIGLTDGLVHKDYMDENEVYHTILHEIGHAIGLGHSPFDSDIMYTPHKYGIVSLSTKDKNTIKWLYKIPFGMSVDEISSKYQVPSNSIDYIVSNIIQKKVPSEFEKIKKELHTKNGKDLLQEAQNIGELKRYNVQLQNIKISEDIRSFLINKNNKKK